MASIIVIGIATLIGAVVLEKKAYNDLAKQTYDLSDEMILQQPYFEVLAAADENRHLPSDVISYNLGDGYIHLVLPGAVSRRNVVVYFRDENGSLLARREYDFTQKVMIGDWEIVVDTPDIPTLYFNTNDADDYSKMIESPTMNLQCNGSMRLCVDKNLAKEKGWFSEYLSVSDKKSSPYSASLQGRGNSSWDCDTKKSFTLKLGKSINLLGMGSEKNWNLIGNAFDPSLLKNTTFNNLANELGIKYQPKMEYVNLYVDGVYQGVYLLTSKIKVSKNQIPLSKGDFLFKMDAPKPKQPIKYNSKTWFEDGNLYPVADLVYPEDASEKKLEKASESIQRLIDCIEDPENEDFYNLVDMDSLVKYYWIQEATMNFDAWQRSVYLYYVASEDKFYFGPVWDMDLTIGSPYEKAGMTFDYPEGFRIANAGWYTKLFERKDFVDALVDAYNNQGVREALIDSVEELSRQKEILGADGYLNYVFYGHANMGTTLPFGDTYDEYCDNMIEFYKARIEFIDNWMRG